MSANYHFFTDEEFAGPTPQHVLTFWDRSPRQLRTKPRVKIPTMNYPDTNTRCVPIRATKADAMEISTFWNSHYSGKDWSFRCDFKDVERWLDQGFMLLLKHRSGPKLEIMATFLCRILPGGITCGKYVPQAAILDGFVVHPNLRGTGIASMMFAAIDREVYSTPELKECALVCFREVPNMLASIHQAPIAILKYSYVFITDLTAYTTEGATRLDETQVNNIVNTVIKNSRSEFTLSSRNISDPDIYWYQVNSSVVGIAYTHRISEDGHDIWEVIFAANLSPPHFSNLQIPIEISAKQLPTEKGVLFATNGRSRGNLSSPGTPWRSGTSGCLSVHVYNWMSPVFINGDILFPHNCV